MPEFDLRRLEPFDAYRVLRGIVTPRPIALVTTLDADGRVNAAPFSFFNALAFDPCLVGLGIEPRADGRPKDTSANIRDTGQFVVNMVDRALAEQMNQCSAPLEPGDSEIEIAGLTLLPSLCVDPPRIAEAPAHLECRRHVTVQLGGRRDIVIGEVMRIGVREGLIDPESFAVDSHGLDLIARLGGNRYATTRETFTMRRPDGRHG